MLRKICIATVNGLLGALQVRYHAARMRRTLKRQRTIVGRLQRKIERKLAPLTQAARDTLAGTVTKAGRVFEQTKAKTFKGGTPKF